MAPESEYLKTLVTEINENDERRSSTGLLANAMLAMDKVSHERHKTLENKIDKLSVAIMGNGTPENAIITRVCRNEKMLKWIFGGLGFCGLGIGTWILDAILNGIN